jgi:hypothetical protein
VTTKEWAAVDIHYYHLAWTCMHGMDWRIRDRSDPRGSRLRLVHAVCAHARSSTPSCMIVLVHGRVLGLYDARMHPCIHHLESHNTLARTLRGACTPALHATDLRADETKILNSLAHVNLTVHIFQQGRIGSVGPIACCWQLAQQHGHRDRRDRTVPRASRVRVCACHTLSTACRRRPAATSLGCASSSPHSPSSSSAAAAAAACHCSVVLPRPMWRRRRRAGRGPSPAAAAASSSSGRAPWPSRARTAPPSRRWSRRTASGPGTAPTPRPSAAASPPPSTPPAASPRRRTPSALARRRTAHPCPVCMHTRTYRHACTHGDGVSVDRTVICWS